MNVVLVHGFMNRGWVFGRLQRQLVGLGHQCVSPSLKPNDARHGIADLAQKLGEIADDAFGAEQPLAIVGFSMGGLVARYYVQRLEGYRRTKALFTISSPHRGAMTAYLYPGQGTRDMRPGSPFLRELESTADCLGGVALHAYWTPLDLMVVPSTSSRWSSASEFKIWLPLHTLMPHNRRICDDICRKIEQAS